MTEVPVCESLRCVFFFSFLCDSWLGNGSSCLLEVVASSAGEKGVHMDLRTAIRWYLHRGRKKHKQERTTAQSSICCRVCKH